MRTEHSLRPAARVILATAAILMVPLVAMQFTDQVVWSGSDFVVAGLLLAGAGLTFQAFAKKARSQAYRVAAGIAVGSALLLVWINLAVGIIGSEDNPANLMYGGVLAIGFIGAVSARFGPNGLAATLFAMAVAQVLVAVIALGTGQHQSDLRAAFEVVGVTGMFVTLFVTSALLFRHAARRQNKAS